MLAVNCDEALMADATCEDVDFLLEFVHRKDAAFLLSVALAETAVAAAVHAGVGDVERREDDNAVVVDFLLYAVGSRAHLGEELRVVDGGHKHRRLLREQGLASRLALRDYFPDAHGVCGLLGDIRDAATDLRVVDEMLAAREILVDLFLHNEVTRIVRRVLELSYL